jgi:hypothetical protein
VTSGTGLPVLLSIATRSVSKDALASSSAMIFPSYAAFSLVGMIELSFQSITGPFAAD